MTVLTRRNATTVLYVKPIISARNLSTLIAVDVSIATAHQTCAVDSLVKNGLVDVYYPSKEIVKPGCEIRPISVTARHQNRRFVEG